MKFGTTIKICHGEYLANYTCKSCGKAHDTRLLLCCQAFVTGPVTWWAWDKRGYLECESCGAVSDIHPTSGDFAEARRIYIRKGIPFYFYASIVAAGLLLVIAVFAALNGFVFHTFTKQKLTGLWVSSNQLSRIYFFDDDQYTLIDNDTILFGNYKFNEVSGKINIPITGNDNIIDKGDLGYLSLDYEHYRGVTFSRAGVADKGDNPYEKRFNTWRMKATHNESPAELRARVMGYLYYVQLKYKWAIANKLNFLPDDLYSPVLQAQEGIGIHEASIRAWRRLFYSDENWITASRFLYEAFPREHALHKREANAFEENLGAINAYIESARQTPIYE